MDRPNQALKMQNAAIEFRHWPLCLTVIRVDRSAAGKTVRCPGCGKPLPVPRSAAQKAEAARAKAEESFRASKARAHEAALKAAAANESRAIAASEAALLPPPPPAAPKRYSPFEWGLGIGCGVIMAGLLFFVLQVVGCGAVIAGMFR